MLFLTTAKLSNIFEVFRKNYLRSHLPALQDTAELPVLQPAGQNRHAGILREILTYLNFKMPKWPVSARKKIKKPGKRRTPGQNAVT